MSDHFANAGVVERRISLVWHKILSEGCPPQPGGQPGLVLDVVRAQLLHGARCAVCACAASGH